MSLLVKLALVGLSCYLLGTVVGPSAGDVTEQSIDALSPFMLIAAAILIASIGYAVGAIRRIK